MNRIHHLFRVSIVAAVLCLSGAGLYAQSTVNEIVRAQSSDNDFNIFIDPYALELFGDSVIVSLNSDADASWNTWKDVLTNGNYPGMDVNFDGNTAYGIDSLLVAGAAELDSTLRVDGYVRFTDSLYVALYSYFAANLEVAGNTDVTGNLSVTGTATAASGSSIGSLTLADGSITDSSGAISFGDEALSTTGTAATGTLTVTGTGSFSSTTSSASGSTVGNLTLADGSITDSSGAISFGDEALSTTGTAATGALTVTGTGSFSSTTSSASGSTVGNLTLADGSITDSSGAISFGDEALSTTGTAATGALTVTGTGSFSSTTSSASGSTVGNLTLADGSITDSSGAISFGDEALSTTGTAATGALTVTGTGSFSSTTSSASGSTVGNLTLADGSITDSSGAISFGDEALSTTGTLASGTQTVTGNVTASGTVQAEQLTSTDDLTVADVANIDGTLDLATGSITDSSGAISFGDEALSTTGTAATGALTVTGTGSFSSTTSSASGSTVGNLTLADGSITDSSGAISFGDEALSTTGTAATGALTVTGTGSFSSTTSSASGSTVGNLTLADGSITDSSGAISFGDEALSTTGTLASGTQTVTGNVTASGTVEAEQLTSTDDLTVADVANIDGTLDLATGSITDQTGAISFGDEALSTTGTAATGALTVTGTGSFSSTTSSASGSTVGNLTLADGSITDSSGAISFGDEALSTTGTLASGTQTVTGNVTASGTVQAEQLTSTDDLTVADVANIDGTLDLATGSITDQTGAISFGDEALSTTGTAATGALTVTGTGSFSSTTSAASGSTVGNLTLADGSITDSSGAISFGDEALSTSGTLASGTQTVTGNVTASGTVEAEQLTSTDDLTVADVANIDGTLDLATGSITDQTGAISFGDEALSTTGTAATGALTVTGTGSFSSTTSSASGSTVGNLTLADGSITDSSGAISFGDEALSTTGTAATGALTVTGTGSFSSTTSSASGSTVGNLTLADGSITDSSGAISFGDEALSTTGALASGNQTVTGNVTASGTVQAEQLTSTDDLTVADVANIDGTLDLATGSITDQTGSISFGDNDLSTTGVLDMLSGEANIWYLYVPSYGAAELGGGLEVNSSGTFFSNSVNFFNQEMTNVNIDSGVIDGVTIATSDVTVGLGKTLDVSAGALTLAAGQVTADKVGAGTFDAGTYSLAGSTISNLGTVTTADINGGTIDGATIATSDVTVGLGKTLDVSAGALTLAAGQVTADKVGAGTFDAGTYSLAGSTISNLGTVTTADIDGGTIDGVTIATSNVTVGLGKTLDVSAGALTLAAGQVTADKVGTGTFNAGTYSFDGSTITDLGDVDYAYIKGGLITDTYITITSSGYLATNPGSTVDLSNAILTLDDDQISGDAIDGGTIGAVTINQLNLASGAESPATRSTVLGQLIAAASSIDQAAIAAPYNTGTYIDLPPGKWNVFINMQTDQGYNSFLMHGAGAGGGSIALGLSTSNVAYTPIASQFHTESLVGGSIDGDHSIYDMIQGQLLIDQTSGSTVRLYLWVKSIVNSSGNPSTSNSTWTKPGSDIWDLNSLYAVPVNW